MPAALPPDATLYDIAPTVLAAYDLPVPADMRGRALA
jgi:bisphosphoglycerate-independent phosphoglycerate mutase (AlkP superfamily)